MQNELHVSVPGKLIFKIISSVGQVQWEERGCLFPNVEWTAVLFHDLQVHSHWHHQPCRSKSISKRLIASTNVETRGSLSASSPLPSLSSTFPLVADWQSSLIVMVAIVLMVSFAVLDCGFLLPFSPPQGSSWLLRTDSKLLWQLILMSLTKYKIHGVIKLLYYKQQPHTEAPKQDRDWIFMS